MADAAALHQTMDRVIAADAVGLWKQGEWITRESIARVLDDGDPMCHTAGCFAGHYVFSQGYTQFDWGQVLIDGLVWHDRETLTNPATGKSLDISRIAGFAANGLGLTSPEAEALFHSHNTLEDLKYLVDRIAAGEPVEPLHDQEEPTW